MERLFSVYNPDDLERSILIKAKQREIKKHKKIIEQLKSDLSAL